MNLRPALTRVWRESSSSTWVSTPTGFGLCKSIVPARYSSFTPHGVGISLSSSVYTNIAAHNSEPSFSSLSTSSDNKHRFSAAAREFSHSSPVFISAAMSVPSDPPNEPPAEALRVEDPAAQTKVAEAKSVQSQEDVIVQYVVIRKDLVSGLNWPLGSVISQGCHAAVAAVWLFKDDPITMQYCQPESLDKMHKVTLEVKGETQLRNLAQKLESGGVAHKLWIEQPENYATCLATKPYYKSEVASHFKKLKLCK